MTEPTPPESKPTAEDRTIYEAAWSAMPLDAKPDADASQATQAKPGSDKKAGGKEPSADTGSETDSAARSVVRRYWEDHRPLLILSAGTLVLLFGLLLAFLGYRADQASNEVTPEELARAQASLEEEREIVGKGRETVEAYLAAVEAYVVSVAEVDALSAQELAKSEEIAAAFGTNVETFNRLVGEREAILAAMNLKIEELQDAGAKVDEAFTDLSELGEIAGRARAAGEN
ncbi:MAG: hypothetical protein IT198_00675 [Acidimicrobiia bacterium]|nr:hypothetical protein [Acidimicrobiia bacterium]